VFVVACLGDWRAAAEVLFERESVQKNSAKSGTAREEIAGTLAARSGECRNNPEQLVAGTLGCAIAKSRTELDNHGAYIPVFQPVPYDLFQITAPVNRQNRQPGDPCHTLARDNAAHAAVAQAMTVRRLTPRECERLQGFPDDYTLIPWRKKQAEDCPDVPRYKALGNSMAVNCMEWIGERIAAKETRR
jgi:site-specific DNA-cytosine methylase